MVKADNHEHSVASLMIPFSLFVAMLAIYTLTTSGSLHSNDELGILAVTSSLVKHGTFDANIASRLYHGGFDDIVVPGIDGTYFTVKGLTPSVLAAPLYALALLLPSGFSIESVTLLSGPIMMALAVALLFVLARQLGYAPRIAYIGALAFGLATYAWPYAEGLFTETSAMLLLIGSVSLLERAIQRSDWRPALLAGLAYGGAVGAVLAVSLLAPALGAYTLYRIATRGTDWQRQWKRLILHPIVLALMGGAAIMLAGLAAYNWARFGGPTMRYFSHPENNLDLSNWRVGLPGLFLHLDRGLLPHIPLFLLLPWGAWLGWRAGRAEVFIGLFGLIALALFYGSFNRWEGGVAWGARYLSPVTPLLCLTLLPLLDKALTERRSGALVALGGLTGVSLYLQALGAFGDWVPVVSSLVGDVTPVAGLSTYRIPHTIEDWVGVSQLRALWTDTLDVWWAGRAGTIGPWALFLIFVVSVAIGALLAWQHGRKRVPTNVGGAALALGLALWAAVLPSYATRDDRLYTAALEAVAAEARPNDVLLVVGPSGIEEFVRSYRGQWRAYSARVHAYPLTPDAEGIVASAAVAGPRLWMLSTGFAPSDPGNGVDRWLSANVYKGPVAWQGDVLVTLYGTGPRGESTPVEATWGETLTLESYAYHQGTYAPGEVVGVDLTWRALTQPKTDYRFFVHLLDGSDALVGQTDYQAQGGYGSPRSWEAGEIIDDRVGLNLPLGLPPGRYELWLGVVDPATGERLTVQSADGFEDNSLLLGEIIVAE